MCNATSDIKQFYAPRGEDNTYKGSAVEEDLWGAVGRLEGQAPLPCE
jgi:hypothetical protein